MARVSHCYIFSYSPKVREGHLTLLLQMSQTFDNYKQQSKEEN